MPGGGGVLRASSDRSGGSHPRYDKIYAQVLFEVASSDSGGVQWEGHGFGGEPIQQRPEF